MLIELQRQLCRMVAPGEQVVCGVSGGADSMALLWGLYLLKEKLGISLSAAHFNHNLRGEESLGDEQFVREFCRRYEIPLYVGSGTVEPGEKGLEAAARDARYTFLNTLPGKIATAHTADDNAETVLMHLVRGTGLKGLGGIAPVNGRLIRPMLGITRQQVEAFLTQWNIPHREDGSNETDDFLRNRLRHHVMPLLKEENPRLAENLSATALRLRQDEEALARLATFETLPDVDTLKETHPAVRSRMLERFLKQNGVREPEARHIAMAEALVFSGRPSAKAEFPGDVVIGRRYNRLEARLPEVALEPVQLPEQGRVSLPQWNLELVIGPAAHIQNTDSVFTVTARGPLVLRSRREGDSLRRPGGTRSLKKLFVDQKIPAHLRSRIPVIADDEGILAVCGIGANLDRVPEKLPAIQIRFQFIEK